MFLCFKLETIVSYWEASCKSVYIFNRENPQNSEPQNGPRRGLDFIALKFMEEISIKSSLSYRTWHAGLYSIDYKLNWNLILRNSTKWSFNNGTKYIILSMLTFENKQFLQLLKLKFTYYFLSKITIINEDKGLEDLIVVFMGNLNL